jgi:hypothetical protein
MQPSTQDKSRLELNHLYFQLYLRQKWTASLKREAKNWIEKKREIIKYLEQKLWYIQGWSIILDYLPLYKEQIYTDFFPRVYRLKPLRNHDLGCDNFLMNRLSSNFILSFPRFMLRQDRELKQRSKAQRNSEMMQKNWTLISPQFLDARIKATYSLGFQFC